MDITVNYRPYIKNYSIILISIKNNVLKTIIYVGTTKINLAYRYRIFPRNRNEILHLLSIHNLRTL